MFTKIRNGIATAMRWVHKGLGKVYNWAMLVPGWIAFGGLFAGGATFVVAGNLGDHASGSWKRKLWAWPAIAILVAVTAPFFVIGLVVWGALIVVDFVTTWVSRCYNWVVNFIDAPITASQSN